MDHDGRINILEFDKIIRHYHRLLLSQKFDSEPETEDEELKKSAISLTFSPSRVSSKCPNCEIGLAGPPQERNLRYDLIHSLSVCTVSLSVCHVHDNYDRKSWGHDLPGMHVFLHQVLYTWSARSITEVLLLSESVKEKICQVCLHPESSKGTQKFNVSTTISRFVKIHSYLDH